MISIDIPGDKKIHIEHLVFDYNGTLAIDGKMIDGVKPLLEILGTKVSIHILTADTFGTSKAQLSGINCKLEILKPELQDKQKESYVLKLGKDKVIALGNGRNDALMLKQAEIGIAVIQQEGAYAKLFTDCEIVCFSITDALALIINPLRMVATLRK